MQAGESAGPAAAPGVQRGINGGRFDFDDGGTYCGGWEDHKANGHGVCTGPKGKGAYAGSWHYGFEVSGVYTWPSGSTFEGQWQNGKRHGLGVETRGRWRYRGEWTQGCKGRYGVRQSSTSDAKYEGTWAHGLQEGYGAETYADGGKYQGQWLRGMRHGYGVRASATFGLASQYRATGVGAAGARGSTSSLADGSPGTPDPSERRTTRIDESRGGFVLKARSDEPPARRNSLVEKTKKGLLSGLKIRKQRSTGELEKRGGGTGGSIKSAGSAASWVSSVESSHSHVSMHTDSNASFIVEDEHLGADVTETYLGEWKNDKRTGFGVSERSDGLRYEGEWFANRKYGYGVTIFRDGTREEGKYKNNVLITSQKRKHMFLMRSAKFRERIEAAISAAQRASKIAMQKADIAVSRAATARGKAEQADEAADQAKEDCDLAQLTAKQLAPDFKLPNMDRIRLRERYRPPPDDAQPSKSILHDSEKTIPNHIPPQTEYKLPNSVPTARRPSAAYPRTVQPGDQRFNNGPTYPTADPALAAPLDNAYEYRNDASTIPHNNNANVPDRFQQPSDPYNQPPGPYQNNQMPTSYRTPNRQDPGGYQSDMNTQNTAQNFAQSSYQQPQVGRRQSYQTTMQSQRPPPQPEWNQPQESTRRPSVLGQPNQGMRNQYSNTASDYDRDYRSGAVYTEGPPDRLGQTGTTTQRLPDNQFSRLPTDYDVADSSRDSRQNGGRPPLTGQASIDHFDHYKRPPSRDSSVDRYGRRSRQPSVEASVPPPGTTGSGSRSGSVAPPAGPPSAAGSRPMSRAATPAGNGHLTSGRGSVSRAATREGLPFEESLMRKRTLGQDISPSPYQPKRTESLFVAGLPAPPLVPAASGGGGGGGRKMLSTPQAIQRKKSLPDVQGYQRSAEVMSREEVSALGSARREEVRRMAEESERLRANPLLYLVSPQVKEWFSRQQLVILVLFINISLGIMFYKLLT